MGLKGAVIFGSAVDEMQRSAKNLWTLQQARKKRDQEDQIFEINKKKANLSLEEAALKNQTTSIQNQTQKALMDDYFKQQKTINDGKDAQIDQEEHRQMQNGEQASRVAKTIYQNDPMVQSMVAQRINPRLTTVPGPNGGMVTGEDASIDNTPEAVPSAFSNIPENPMKASLTSKGFVLKSQKQAEFIANKIEKQKAAGIPLLPEEQYFDYRNTLAKQGIKYNRGAVLRQAKDLVKSEGGKDAIVTPKMIADMIPEAENSLYGLSFADHIGEGAPKADTTQDQTIDESLPVTKKTDLGKVDDKIIVKDKSGKKFKLPKNQLEEAKRQGYVLAN